MQQKVFVWACTCLCICVCCELVCDIDHFFHQCSKSGGSPTAWQIGTPDLCLCLPLICLPRHAIIPPLPTRTNRWSVHWGVLDLRCTVGWRGTGSDQIRRDSLCDCVCLGAGKSYRYQRGFLGGLNFPTASAMNLTTPYFISKHSQ